MVGRATHETGDETLVGTRTALLDRFGRHITTLRNIDQAFSVNDLDAAIGDRYQAEGFELPQDLIHR